MDLAYMGFTQEAGIRRYYFERQLVPPRSLAIPSRTVTFVVLADMSLFSRYNIPIQEGLANCRGILIEATMRLPEGEIASASYPVEETHLASFATARTAQAEAKSARRHKPPIQTK